LRRSVVAVRMYSSFVEMRGGRPRLNRVEVVAHGTPRDPRRARLVVESDLLPRTRAATHLVPRYTRHMGRFRAILFDLDGTLLDSIGLILDSFHHTFAAHGIPARTDAEHRATIGIPLAVVLAQFASPDRSLDAMLATYRAYNFEHHDSRITAYPGVVAMVRELTARHLRLAIVTSKSRRSTTRGLALAGIEHAFEALVCSDDVKHPKPHREPVDRALSLLGVGAEEALFVGDSPHDMHAGNATGIATAAALWGPFSREELEPSRPTYVVATPEELQALVDRVARE